MLCRAVYVVTAVTVQVDGWPVREPTATQAEKELEQTCVRFCEDGPYNSLNGNVGTRIEGRVVATENPVLVPAPPFRTFDFAQLLPGEERKRQRDDPTVKFPRKIQRHG